MKPPARLTGHAICGRRYGLRMVCKRSQKSRKRSFWKWGLAMLWRHSQGNVWPKQPDTVILNSIRHPQDVAHSDAPFFTACAGKLWAAGGRLDWSRYFAYEQRRRIQLPTYPFQHQRYWIDPPGSNELNRAKQTRKRHDVSDWFYLPSWQRSLPPGEQPQSGSHWLLFVDQCRLGAALARRLEEYDVHVTLVREGRHFAQDSVGAYELDPGQREDYDMLMRALRDSDRVPQTILHLWNFTPKHKASRNSVTASAARDLSFYSLIFFGPSIRGFNWLVLDHHRFEQFT